MYQIGTAGVGVSRLEGHDHWEFYPLTIARCACHPQRVCGGSLPTDGDGGSGFLEGTLPSFLAALGTVSDALVNQLAQLLSPQQRAVMERVREAIVPPPLEQSSPAGNSLGQPPFSPPSMESQTG